MRSLRVAGIAACFVAVIAGAEKKPITMETVAGYRPEFPPSIYWAPDGKKFAYLDKKQILEYDAATGKSTPIASMDGLDKKAAAVPKAAAFDWKNRGVSEATLQWLPGSNGFLVAQGGDLFMWTASSGQWEQLTNTEIDERDPRMSPDGRMVGFRRDNDLYVMDVETRSVKRLTQDGTETLLNGKLDWVYPEELGLERAWWWSPDGKSIAYLQFDISRELIHPQVDLTGAMGVYEPQRYPKAGTPNADVRLGVVPVAGGLTKWMDLGETRDFLLARIKWMPDSAAIAVQRLDRVQKHLDLLLADAQTGVARKLLTETDPYWLNVSDAFHVLPSQKQFLWASERSGFRHLYLYSMDGQLVRQLTQGDWEVASVAGVDEKARQVYFLSTEDSPIERQLYRVSFDGGKREKLSKGAGTHNVQMSPTAQFYLDSASSAVQPARQVIFDAKGDQKAVFREADRRVLDEFDVVAPEFLTVKAPDGAILQAKMLKPAGFQKGKKYPAVVMVYGGPHAQDVRNMWSGLGRFGGLDQILAHKGYVVWQLDNRGTSGRGHQWEAKLNRRLGQQELADQRTGVEYLISLGFVDPARVGVTGWSYGGFMTLYSMLNASDMFKVGVAGAPVTDWQNYDTIYTERYLGLPQENREGYQNSSPVNYAANLKGKLMLIHNLEDDNVLFQNTVQMMVALEKAGKQAELRLYPFKSHGVMGPMQRHMLEAMLNFFDENLKGH